MLSSVYLSTVPLTTGADTQTASTFNGDLTTGATTQTLQGYDVLTGTAGGTNNKLAIISGTASTATAGTVLPAGLTLSNIPTITLNATGNAGNAVGGGGSVATQFSTSTVTGVTQLTVNTSGAFGDNIMAAATTNVTETYNGTGGTNDFISIRGGKNIIVTDNGSSSGVAVGGIAAAAGVAATDAAATAASAAAGTVVVKENGNGAVYVEGGTTVTVTTAVTTGNAGLITIGAVVGASGAVTVNETNTVAKSTTGVITVGGGTSAAITSNVKGAAASVAVTSGVTGASTIIANGVAVAAAGIDVVGGTGVTITTTNAGQTSGTNGVVLGATLAAPTTVTTAVVGNATVTDTFSGPVSYARLFNLTAVTGTVTLNTTATSGAVNVGVAAATYNPTGAVSIVNQTVAGTKTYYGTSTTAVNTNGSTSVSVTGGGGTTITDRGATNALTSATLTGIQGSASVVSTKLATLNINNSTLLTPMNAVVTGTVATVTNTTVDHTLAVNLSGDTAATTSVTDANAQVINVTASGTTANSIILVAADVPALSAAKTLSFTNNSTGTLTVAGVTNTGATTVVTVAGSGAVNLGNTAAWTVIPTSITGTTATGAITATIDGQTSSFSGGSGANTITVTSVSAIAGNTIYGGSGSNNTLIATSAVGNYSTTFGGSLSGFHNLELKGASVTSDPGTAATYYISSAYSNLLVSGLTQAQQSATHGNSVTFSSVAAGTALKVLDQATTVPVQKILITSSGSGADDISLKINGIPHYFLNLSGTVGTAAGTIATYYNTGGAGAIPGVKVGLTTTNAANDTIVITTVDPTTVPLAASQLTVGATETGTVTLTGGMTATQTIILGGLTYTSTAVTTQAQAAAAFAGLANGATTGAATATGVYSGTLTGWTTSAVMGTGGYTVVFTSTTANDGTVVDLADTGTGVTTVTANQGSALADSGDSVLTMSSVTAPSLHVFTLATDVNDGNYVVVINGVSHAIAATTTLKTDAASIATAFSGAAALPGVTVTSNGIDTLYVTGAATVATSVTGSSTISTSDTLSGVTTELYSVAAAAATGNTLPITLNSATGTAAVTSVIQEANNQTISINSVKALNNGTNTLTIQDGTLTAAANQATKITVTGAGKLALTYGMDGTALSALATIDASGSTGTVNVGPTVTVDAGGVARTTGGVVGVTTGLTITGGTAALTAAGSGTFAGATVASYYGAVDTITTGSGGGTITTGYAGATVNTGSGSQIINLGASTAVADLIKIGAAGQHATANGFTILGTSKTDKIDLNNLTTSTTAVAGVNTTVTTPVTQLLSNVTTSTAVPAGPAGITVGSNTYKVSNGIITFTGADSGITLLYDALAIVDATGSTSQLAAYSDGTNTYVVQSSTADTSATNAVITLNGVTGVTGFGMTPAAGIIVLNGASTVNGTALVGTPGTTTAANGYAAKDTTTTALTQDDTGYFEQYYSGATTGAKVFNNLAASAIIDSASTGSAAGYTLTTTQLGTAGSESLTVNLSGAQTIAAASFTGDNAVTIKTTANSVITSLIDPGNTMATLTLSGGATAALSGTLSIPSITDTALTSISISNLKAVSLGTLAAPIAKDGLTVSISATTTPAHAIYLSGVGATIDASGVTTGSTTAIFSATGANSIIKGGIGATGEQFIAGTGATVTMLQGVAATASSTFTAVTGDNKANLITVGAGSTVNLGTSSTGLASDGGSTVKVMGDVTGALSSGTVSMVTVNNVVNASTKLHFFAATGTTELLGGDANGFVNVASATSLADALDIAAANESAAAVAGSHSYDWFQYAGNDYVVAHTGVAGSALSATDIVVVITGLIDLSSMATHNATTFGVTL